MTPAAFALSASNPPSPWLQQRGNVQLSLQNFPGVSFGLQLNLLPGIVNELCGEQSNMPIQIKFKQKSFTEKLKYEQLFNFKYINKR